MSNKFNAKKLDVDGMKFDSRKEYQRWCELRLLERAGKIRDLQRQVPYVLIPTQKRKGKVVERECRYVADFTYLENGELVVEDVKGDKKGAAYSTFVIKRKLMLEKYNIRVRET